MVPAVSRRYLLFVSSTFALLAATALVFAISIPLPNIPDRGADWRHSEVEIEADFQQVTSSRWLQQLDPDAYARVLEKRVALAADAAAKRQRLVDNALELGDRNPDDAAGRLAAAMYDAVQYASAWRLFAVSAIATGLLAALIGLLAALTARPDRRGSLAVVAISSNLLALLPAVIVAWMSAPMIGISIIGLLVTEAFAVFCASRLALADRDQLGRARLRGELR
jgi:hypothetical protein